MTTNRVIPFGYAMEGGKLVAHSTESLVVRRIYTDYAHGASLLGIARALAAEGVEFLPGRSDWNKNRVGRILEDERYTGTDSYPVIVDEALRQQVRTARHTNNNQPPQSEQSSRLPCPVECAVCGGRMARRHDRRRKASQEVWSCRNPECKQVVNLNDADLLAGVAGILNRLAANPHLIRTGADVAPVEANAEVRRLQGEVNRLLDAHDPDKDALKAAAFALAAEKYKAISTDDIQTQLLRTAFKDSALSTEPPASYIPALLKRTVLKVRLESGGEISLILKNHQTIGKEREYADSGHNGNAGSGATTG